MSMREVADYGLVFSEEGAEEAERQRRRCWTRFPLVGLSEI